MAGAPSYPIAAVAGTAAQLPAIGKVPATRSLPATHRGRGRVRGNVAGAYSMLQYQPGGYQDGGQRMQRQQQQQHKVNTQGGYQQQPQGMQYGNQRPLPTNFS